MNYTYEKDFEWDQAKSEACFTPRGFDFEYVSSAFSDQNRLIWEDIRFQYGESRYQMLGKIQSRVFAVAYTYRLNMIRIISAHKANIREVERYENSHTTD
jgi:uncharacterized DUF497 family protein